MSLFTRNCCAEPRSRASNPVHTRKFMWISQLPRIIQKFLAPRRCRFFLRRSDWLGLTSGRLHRVQQDQSGVRLFHFLGYLGLPTPGCCNWPRRHRKKVRHMQFSFNSITTTTSNKPGVDYDFRPSRAHARFPSVINGTGISGNLKQQYLIIFLYFYLLATLSISFANESKKCLYQYM